MEDGTQVIRGRDEQVQGAVVRVKSGQGSYSFMRRPIQRLYPLEVHSHEDCSGTKDIPSDPDSQTDQSNIEPTTEDTVTIDDSASNRPRHRAAVEARDRIVARLLD